ncbi:MAG: CpsB/CapC family capsule biosynthesis tyrosine phosphatase [Planctomycetota bacterium]
MQQERPFVDIHCHLVPGIDDGAKTWDDTLAMARMAVEDGTRTIIVTPHQLGNFSHNDGDLIRQRTAQVQQVLNDHKIPLQVLPGGDVRIEDGMVRKIGEGSVMSLGDHRLHVLLELPHELYFPIEPVLAKLETAGMQGILSHPERNAGILTNPGLLPGLVDQGCLMQVTCGSLVGTFGPASQRLAESMLNDGLVHFLASDGHSPKSRRPRMGRAYRRATELAGSAIADEICCHNPALVAAGRYVEPGRRQVAQPRGLSRWFGGRRKAA